jgi:2-dehydropantoate 2-reductase
VTRYVVLGAGAVGGVVGARLHLAGVPVVLVARGEHLARIRAGGLTLETPVGTDVLDVPVAGHPAEVGWDEPTVVLLAVKSHQTAAALDDLAAQAPPTTPVVSLQNGVANEAAVLRRFERAYGICVMLPSGHVAPGTVVQRCHPVPDILDVGGFPGGVDDTCEQVAADLRRAGFVSETRPDIMAWKHRKLLMNLGNAVQAAFAPGPAADDLLERVRDEGERALAAAGTPVVTAELDRERRGDLLQAGDRHPDVRGGSTWQSVARGTGDVETDYLTGEVVLLGRLHGVPTPANAAVQHATRRLVAERGPVASLDAADVLAGLPPRHG